MIKRSFFALSQPRLEYDLVEPDPKEPTSIPIPSNLTLFLNEALEEQRAASITKGDAVKKGDKIRLYDESTEYVVSPVTGTIKTINTYTDDFGKIATCLVLENDQSQTSDSESVTYDLKEDPSSADEFLRGLPGAPPLKQLTDETLNIKTIVITFGDADLLCTTNQFVTLTYADEIKQGIQVLQSITDGFKICAIAPEGLDLPAGLESIQVYKTGMAYPSGLPAMVLKDHLNITLIPGQTPEDAGVCFMSPEAVISLGRAYDAKAASFEKHLTVIGKDGTVQRAVATIGTPLSKVFDAFSIQIGERDRIVIGGPLKGYTIFTHDHPVTPDMDMVIIQDRDIIPELSDNPCVNCGRCIQICPADVPVNLLVRYLEANRYEEAFDQFDLGSCIDCGLCAYVCLARIPLFQHIRLGKHELTKLRADA